jgi:hypothetical protein
MVNQILQTCQCFTKHISPEGDILIRQAVPLAWWQQQQEQPRLSDTVIGGSFQITHR